MQIIKYYFMLMDFKVRISHALTTNLNTMINMRRKSNAQRTNHTTMFGWISTYGKLVLNHSLTLKQFYLRKRSQIINKISKKHYMKKNKNLSCHMGYHLRSNYSHLR